MKSGSEAHGGEMLRKTGLWKKINVFTVSDPLMLALNPKRLTDSIQRHLIVENKTTYQALLPALRESEFSTLIYGQGNKVVRSIEKLSRTVSSWGCPFFN